MLNKIEKHRATRIYSLKGFSYEQRLERLCLPILEAKKLPGTMIQLYKVLNAIKWHNPQEFYVESITRDHITKETDS